MLTTIVTVGIGVKTKTEAQAQEKIFDWFSRISVKKCAISLEKNSFSWTGEQITPEVRVNYKGTDLVKNVDYVLTYKNNVDAGTGTIVVEGKGQFSGRIVKTTSYIERLIEDGIYADDYEE